MNKTFFRPLVLATALSFLPGCQQTVRTAQTRTESEPGGILPPTLARMQKTYPDLHTGRFICLADFNTKDQAELCRTLLPEGAASENQPTISVLRSINETGAGGLKVTLSSPDEALVFDGQRSATLALVRDWRRYNVLLFNMHGPPTGATVEFSVENGVEPLIRWSRTLYAKPGWQLYRVDLAEIGDSVDLCDIRALCWRLPELTTPVDLFLDDVIIADNTRFLLGQNALAGEPYVVSRGRRVHVGVHERFDLALCDGVIVEWHADRSPNLTVRSGLGPWPVPLPEGWDRRQAEPVVYDDPRLFRKWAARVAATQRLVEVSEFRVVVEGLWRFLPTGGTQLETGSNATPQHAWRYVIYPTGEVYVRVASSAADAGWPDARLGYAIALDGRSGFERIAPTSSRMGHEEPGFVLWSQQGPDRPDLLWSPHQPDLAGRQLELASADERRVAVTIGEITPTERVETAHLLRFHPQDIDAAPEAESFAADYQQPAVLMPSRGRVVTDAAGDLDHDGFNESEGCYELEAADELLRFRFLPDARLRHRPVFRVRGTIGKDCWVYAEGRIIRAQGRDARGNLLFKLPEPVGMPLTIEVNARSRSSEL